MLKFLKKNSFIFFLGVMLFLIYFPKNNYIIFAQIIITILMMSLLINMYLSMTVPLVIKTINEYISKQSEIKFLIIFSIATLIVWNYSLYIPEKTFELFTAGLVFIPNFLNSKNKSSSSDVFKILLIFAAVEFLKDTKYNVDLVSTNKLKFILENIKFPNKINFDPSVYLVKPTLYTKFYFLSLKILSNCIKYDEDIEKEKKE